MEYYVNIFACVYCIVLEWIVRAKIRTETGGNGLWCVLNGFLRLFVAAAACLRAGISGGTERVPRGRIGSVGWSALWGAMAESGGWAVRVGDAESEIGLPRGRSARNWWLERVAGRREDSRRDGSAGSPAVLPRGQPALDNPHLSTHTCHSAPVNPYLSTRTCQPALRTCYCTPVIARCQSTSILRAFVPFPMPLPGR